MSFDSESRKQFQWKVLKDQFRTILHQFQQLANQWLQQSIKQMGLNSETFLAKKTTSEIHPNHIMAELKRLNYERAYIEYKIQALEHNIQIPMPEELHRRLRKTEMEIKFQKEFPCQYRTFQRQLKKKLREKPYQPNRKAKKSNDLDLDLPIWFTDPPQTKPRKRSVSFSNEIDKKLHRKPVVPTPQKKARTCNNIIKLIHGHGTNSLINKHGYFQPPFFTKEKVEQIVGHAINTKKYHQVRHALNQVQRKRKLGKAKDSHNKRKGKGNT